MITFHKIKNQLVLFFIIRLFLATGERMFAPFLPVISRGLDVEVTRVTLALSLSFVASAFSPFLAGLSDRWGRKPAVLGSLIIYSAGCLLIAFFPNLAGFMLGALMMGMAHSVIIPTILAYLSDRVPYQNRGLYLSLVETSWALSFIIGIPLMAVIVEKFGWQVPFLLLAAVNTILFFAVLRFIPEDRSFLKSSSPFLGHMKSLLGSKPALAGLFIGLLYGMSEHTINIVMGLWMEDAFNLAVLAIGGVASLVGVAQLGGELLSAFGVDRLGKIRSTRAAMLFIIVILLQVFWLGKSFTGAVIWLFLAFFTFEFAFVCSLSLISELLPESRSTMAASYTTFVACGFAVGTYLGSYLYSFGMGYVAISSAILCAIALLLFQVFLIPRLPPDKAGV